MAWRCRFLTARRSQDGRVIAEKSFSEELSGAPDTLFDFHTGRRLQTEFLEAVLAVSREKDVRLGLDDRTHGAPAADPETGEPDVALIEPIELDRWTSLAVYKSNVAARLAATAES